MISLQVFYEGHVQGVGFRWTIRQIAKGFDVIGWVRNLPDGRVELQVGGDESEVFAFLDSIMESELRSHIDKQTRSALAEHFSRFIGMAPMQYLAHWRLQVAAQKLKGTSASLAQIAEAIGYESEAAFSRAFKKKFGSAPATWRRA